MGGTVSPARMLVISNAAILLFSLFPFQLYHSPGKSPNDGLLLLKGWRRPRAEVEHMPYWFYIWECAEQRLRGNKKEAREAATEGLGRFAGDIHLQNLVAFCLSDEGRFSDAQDIHRRLLQQHKDNAEVRALMLNNVAFINAVMGDAKLLPEADEASRQALDHAPLSIYYKGTRGCVLVEMGRYEEGIGLLQETMAAHTENADVALDACFVAIGAARSGNFEMAKDNLALAQKLDPKCWVLERTKRELEQAAERGFSKA